MLCCYTLQVQRTREVQRAGRRRSGKPVLAVVGYTNAGKSSLLQALTHTDTGVEDRYCEPGLKSRSCTPGIIILRMQTGAGFSFVIRWQRQHVVRHESAGCCIQRKWLL